MKTFAKWVALLWSAFCLLGLLVGIFRVSQQATAHSGAAAVGMGVGMFLWVGIWLAIAGPALLIYALTGKPQPSPPAPAAEFETFRPGDLQPDERKCPHCAEIIKKEAKLCRYCRSPLD